MKKIDQAFELAQARYAAMGVDVNRALKALATIKTAELAGDFTTRLAWQEEARTLPFGAVWDFYCQSKNVPAGEAWLTEVKQYEKTVLSKRV